MKPTRSNPLFTRFFSRNNLATAVVVTLTGFTMQPSAHAANLYWDTNGTTADSGNAGGTWDSGTNWSTDSTGASAPSAWVDGQSAVFAAGADGTGAYTVTIAGTVATPSILLEEAGGKTISGGTITIGGGTINTAAAGTANTPTISSTLAGTGGLTVAGNGDMSDTGGGAAGMLALSGANTFVGDMTITSGLVRLNSGFGDAANKIILNGGGIIDNNLSLTSTRNIEAGAAGGTIRLWGSATTNLNGAITGSGALRHTDGGTLRLGGSGAGYTGTFTNVRGNIQLVSTNWSGMDLVNNDGNVATIVTAGETSIKSLSSDRDVVINSGARLNITTGNYTATNGAAGNNFWMQGAGKLTSSSNTLTLNWPVSYVTLGDQSVRVIIEDYSVGTPLAVVKNGPGAVNNYDKANTYTGGTTINGGRMAASNAQAFGTGTVTMTPGGQAYLTAAGTFANNFVINGLGATENAGVLGAIRFQNNTVSGSINVASSARVGAYGGTGTHTGALTGSAPLQINSADANFNGTINFNGNTSGFTGPMTLTQGAVNVGSSGLGGSLSVTAGTASVGGNLGGPLVVNGSTATSTGTTVTTTGGTATVVGSIAGDITVGGGTASADGATAIATAGGGKVTVNGNVAGNVLVNAGTATVLNGGTATAAGGSVTANGATITGNVTVGDGATLAGEPAVSGTLNLGTTAGSTLRIKAGTVGALTAGTVNLAGTNTVVLDTLPIAAGPFVVLDYTTLGTGSETNFVVPSGLYRGNPAVIHDVDNTRFTLELNSQLRTWNGSISTDWNTTDENWDEGDLKFYSGDDVVFANNGVGTVNLVGNLAPLSVKMQNTTGNNFIFAGAGGIVGSTGIAMTGGGNVTLGGVNTYTGAVTVSAGVLTLSGPQSLGQASGVTVAAGARVDLGGQLLGNNTNTSWTIAGDGGDGVGGLGAVTNSGGAIYEDSSILNLTLSANAEIGGSANRFDVGRNGITGAGGLINGGGFTLTKVGANSMVFRGPATNINYVLNQGALTFEDYDAASGTNLITVNAGTLGSYNNRTLPNDVNFTAAGNTLVSQAGNGIWTGAITLGGNTTLQADGNLVIDGSLVGTGNITKAGGGALVLQNSAASFSGKIQHNGGILRVESNAALGTYVGADAITMAGGTLQGGTIAALANATVGSATQGITQTGTVNYDGGAGTTLTVGGTVTGLGGITKVNNSGAVVFSKDVTVAGTVSSNGGTQTFNGNVVLGTGSSFQVGTGIVTNLNCPVFTAPSGFDGWTGTTNLNIGTGTLEDIEIQQNTGESHTFNHLAGNLAVSLDVRIGHWGGATSVYNMSGGSLSQPDTVTNPTDEGQANLFLGIDGTGILNQTGGTINTTSMVLDGRGDTAGDDTYALTGGRLNMGKWGIRSGNTGTTKLIQLGGGIVGASADWTSALPMVLTGTNGNVTINTLDSVNSSTARNIALSGVLSGTGGLTKTGAGVLSLSNAAGTFTGTALVNGGTLLVNSGAAAAGTLKTAAGGTLQPGTLAASGVANTTNLTLDGGGADFRIGTNTDKFVVAGALTVSSATSIRAIPGNAITGSLPQTFDVIDYTGTIGGAVGFAGLTFASSNPHLAGSLVNDVTNTVVQVQISAADSVTWKGNVNGVWDVNATSNWVLGSDGLTSSKYYDFDVVKFDDTGIGAPTVTLTGTITPATLSVENTTGTYTFQGSGIGGSTGLTKTGAGTLAIHTNNAFTGPVSIQGGRVVVGNGGADGALGGNGNIPMGDGTSLAFNRTGAVVLPATRLVTGGGAVENNGAGSLEFQGFHTFTGGLTINAGSVILSTTGGDTGVISGTVTVNNGGTLSATAGNAFGWGANRIHTLNVNGGTVTTSANGDQGWALALNLTSGTIGSTGAGYYSLGGGSAVNYLGDTAQATISGAVRLREGNPGELLPFTVANGAAAVDLRVSGPISEQGGARGIAKTGLGIMELAGANTFSGPVSVSEGILRYTRPVNSVIPNALTGSGGTLEHNSPQELVLSGDGSAFGGTIDANGKMVRLAGDNSGSGTGGTLALEGGTLALGLSTEGLLYYGTLAGAAMDITPLNTAVLSDSTAALHGGIGGNTTIAFDGEIYLTAGDWSFGENVDDAVYVNINGTTIINDNVWNVPATGTFTAPANGWYPITLRVQNGGGGNGPVDAWLTAGIGIGIKTGGTSTNVADYVAFQIGALGTKCRVVKAAGTHTMAGGLTLGGGVANTVDTGDGSLTIGGAVTGGASDSLVKIGTGTLALNGTNTHAGDTVVNAGTLAVNGASIKNSSKLVINGGKVEVTADETVGSLYFGAAAQAPGTYGSTLSAATFKDDTRFSGTGVLIVGGNGYSNWASTNAPTGTAGDDFDGDGVSNGVEWVLGGNKNTNDLSKLPKVSTSGGNLIFTFKRDQNSISPGTSLKIQVGTNLASWPVSYPVPDAPVANNPGVTVVNNGDGTDTITLTIVQAPDATKFGRLNVVID